VAISCLSPEIASAEKLSLAMTEEGYLWRGEGDFIQGFHRAV